MYVLTKHYFCIISLTKMMEYQEEYSLVPITRCHRALMPRGHIQEKDLHFGFIPGTCTRMEHPTTFVTKLVQVSWTCPSSVGTRMVANVISGFGVPIRASQSSTKWEDLSSFDLHFLCEDLEDIPEVVDITVGSFTHHIRVIINYSTPYNPAAPLPPMAIRTVVTGTSGVG